MHIDDADVVDRKVSLTAQRQALQPPLTTQPIRTPAGTRSALCRLSALCKFLILFRLCGARGFRTRPPATICRDCNGRRTSIRGSSAAIRIQGLAIGIDVGDEDYADAVHGKCRRNGLLVSTEGSTMLLLPSLTIDKRTAAKGLDILARSI